jgi:2,3-bisphosphoglycerate-independent phosphoglycerate mutase
MVRAFGILDQILLHKAQSSFNNPFIDQKLMTEAATPSQKVCLIVIDGWGVSDPNHLEGDAIHHANTPVMDHLKQHHAYTELAAHGVAVGLPEGLMGNSEVGHLNIGAGRVVYQV